MNLSFKSEKQRRLVLRLLFCFLTGAALFSVCFDILWNRWDFMALDGFYRRALARGYGPKPAFTPQILYLSFTDESYAYFGKNILDRGDLAEIGNALAELNPLAVAYDLIFARPGNPESDRALRQSFLQLGCAWLPVGCALSETPAPFKWEKGTAYEKFRSEFLVQPKETGKGRPYYAVRALLQHSSFMETAKGSGDISVRADMDRVYRHLPLLIKVDDKYLPTLSLAIFLDWAGVDPDDLRIAWGKSITIPAGSSTAMKSDLIIPIDEQGRAFVPFVGKMSRDFREMEAHRFLQFFEDEELRGNLREYIEGNIVLVADVASGVSDMGATPLERNRPLAVLHANMLNALLTGTFYSRWPGWTAGAVLLFVSFAMGFAAMFRSSRFLYSAGFLILTGLLLLTWAECTHFRFFPIGTVLLFSLVMFFALVITLELSGARERSLIRNTFARYLPEAVVSKLLANPEAFTLGGEERVVTVLFSDIADFTSICEKMAPTDLVALLNAYLTEMTAIIMELGGIIDKFQGDAIMAEFGVPLHMPNHAEQAVMAGLNMQKRLVQLREEWTKKGLPALYCRVGINTGKMIVGNMGSDKVCDYTVIGDAVNLASRLEGANKNYGTSVMISEFTLAALPPGRFRTRILDILRVKGKSQAVKVYEVCGCREDAEEPQEEEYHRTYAEAFHAYLSRDFRTAACLFQKALSLKPDDPAARLMADRINAINPETLPHDWDGSVRLMTK
ncbi:MAG: adenylate/guanylate cyclase domain-containing protein [Desulfobacterales bacterium]